MPACTLSVARFVVLAAFLGFPVCALAADIPDLAALIVLLDDEDADVREDAAEALAEIVDPNVSAPVRKRLAVEKDFHVQLALHCALAAQGEKQSVQFLIDSLKQTGHHGCNYLRRIIGEDYGWEIQKYQAWFAKTSDEQFRAFIRERWRRKPVMDEFAEFASLYSKQYFSDLLAADSTDDFSKNIPRMTDTDVKRLAELPTAKAWTVFESALNELQEHGDRKAAARLFRKVATEFANTYYADQSRELADLLDEMIAEDDKYMPPDDVDKLPLEQQIAFHIHNLRDVVAHQYSQPGYCHVLDNWDSLRGEAKYNAAKALVKIGEPAVPYLTKLLDDRRPIRAVGYWRDFHPLRTVLRHQDAAVQILSAIRADNLYERRTTSSYFSNERPEVQADVKKSAEIAPKAK